MKARGSCSCPPRLSVEGHVQVSGCGLAWHSKYSTHILASRAVSPVAHTETELIESASLHSSKLLLRPRLVGTVYVTM